MAKADLITLRIETEEYNDASNIRIVDRSAWASQSSAVTAARITIKTNNELNGKYIDLIVGADRSIFNGFLSTGLKLKPSNFGVPTAIGFADDYYELKIDITLDDASTKSYTDNQGFLAFVENEIQRLQLDMPGFVRERFMLIHVYAYAAKAAASVGKIEQFYAIVAEINRRLNNYKISYL